MFCGYSLPHPSEDKVNIRLQTKAGTTADAEFKKGLHTLIGVAEHIESVFDSAIEAGPVATVPARRRAHSGGDGSKSSRRRSASVVEVEPEAEVEAGVASRKSRASKTEPEQDDAMEADATATTASKKTKSKR